MSEIKKYLGLLADGKDLSYEDAVRSFQIILLGGATPAQIAALAMALRVKGETIDEIRGAAEVMRSRATKITAPPNALDTCGTGGDNSGTLNISTAVAFVIAGCGVPVAKHGNRAISSKSGSADVLTELGVKVDADIALVERSLKDANICFMMAPRFHRAMQNVSPIRSELGIRTIFNLVGPLCNPASIQYQLLGVFSDKWLVPMAEVLRALGNKHAWVVHGSDGMDELTTTGTTQVAELKDGSITTFQVHPHDAGLDISPAAALEGGSAAHNASALKDLLKGKRGAYRDIILLNAAASLIVTDKAATLKDGVILAAESIDSGKAVRALEKLVEITNLEVV